MEEGFLAQGESKVESVSPHTDVTREVVLSVTDEKGAERERGVWMMRLVVL